MAVLQTLMLAVIALALYMTLAQLISLFKNPTWTTLKDILFSVCTFFFGLAFVGIIQITQTGIL